jgi:tRNA(Ile)-lysidine synthase
MQQAFLDHLKKRKLCAPPDHILLATSGGIDSMVLMDLFLKSGIAISVVHVNFKLRGIDSDNDEDFVRKKCLNNHIPFFTQSFDTIAFAEERKLSIQMAARELRYQWFHELLAQHGFQSVATAHHLNDTIETTLLNLVRGSGPEGWDGIAARNGKIIRPLLFASRSEIENYAAENGITWREDSSNASDDYQRNFLRHRVTPLLKELNPSFEKSFSDSIAKISSSNELAEAGLRAWRKNFVTEKGDRLFISKEGLDAAEHPEGLLWQVIKSFGYNFDQAAQIIFSIHASPGKLFHSATHELVIDRSALILSKKTEGLNEILIEEGQAKATLGRMTLRIEKLSNAEMTKDATVALIPVDKLQFPLTWRAWREGDSFYPLGMQHKKKISDFLIDQKISMAEKKSVTVLVSGNEIAWVVGMRLDDRFKMTAETKSYFKISIANET